MSIQEYAEHQRKLVLGPVLPEPLAEHQAPLAKTDSVLPLPPLAQVHIG